LQLRATMSAIRHPCLIMGQCPSNFEGRNTLTELLRDPNDGLELQEDFKSELKASLNTVQAGGELLSVERVAVNRFSKTLSDGPQVTDELAISKGKQATSILQEIADSGGLGIRDPLAWQREVREDRPLPFRGG
ncbi:MAG: hypothetical protein BECKG1743E_GA0114224_109234, partial [Candidatus Kentron sp. G]